MIWELVAYDIVKKFYKYLILFVFVACIFIGLLMTLYGNPTNVKSTIGISDLLNAWNTPVKKKKTILKKNESRCRNILEQMFEAPFTSIRPDFLKYPKTGKNLELDGYNEEYKLAFEYQGIQHRKYCPGLFHETYDDFVGQQNRDAFKKKRCIEEGIHVIYIPDTIPYDKLEDFLVKEVKEWLVQKDSGRVNDSSDNKSSYSDSEE